MKNTEERFLEKILKEIAKENKIKITSFGDGFILKLEKNKKCCFIYNYNFENNLSTSMLIAKDKSATYEILKNKNIDTVQHTLYYKNLSNLCDFENSKVGKELIKLLKKHKALVLKNNSGTCGNNVFVVKNKDELIEKALLLNEKFSRFSVCPFYEIKHEYRCIILDGDARLIYEKERPTIVGNGKDALHALISKNYPTFVNCENLNLDYVPKQNEKVVISWKHNLKLGATPKIVTNKTLIKQIKTIANKSMNALKLNFASVDIVETGGKLKVLEINAGIMMEKFAQQSKENYNIAKEIYKDAIRKNLNF